jgi:hypothetical protein
LFLDPQEVVETVLINGEVLTMLESRSVFESGAVGWWQEQPGVVYARSGSLRVELGKTFEFILTSG